MIKFYMEMLIRIHHKNNDDCHMNSSKNSWMQKPGMICATKTAIKIP